MVMCPKVSGPFLYLVNSALGFSKRLLLQLRGTSSQLMVLILEQMDELQTIRLAT